MARGVAATVRQEEGAGGGEVKPGKQPKPRSINLVREAADRRLAINAAMHLEDYLVAGDQRFPSMIETMWRMFNDEEFDDHGRYRVSPKDKTVIFQAFARLTGVKEAVLAERGLKGQSAKNVTNNFLQVNLSMEELKALPVEAQERLLKQQLSALGGPPPVVVEAEVA